MVEKKDSDFAKRLQLSDTTKSCVVFLMGVYLHNKLNFKARRFVKKSILEILGELNTKKPDGYLAHELAFGNPTIMVLYWEKYETLLEYARNKSAKHFPAWFQFNTDISGMKAVGLWHEIYKLPPGCYSGVYKNCPPTGMGKFTAVDS